MKIKTLLITALFILVNLFLSCENNTKKDYSIKNSSITATYNQENLSLNVDFKSGKKVILKDFVSIGKGKDILIKEINDPVFGKGEALVITCEDSSYYTFSLYHSQPFIYANQTLHNNSSEILDVQVLNPVSYTVDLGKPANQLKTLGTGGLLDPDKNPGSYVFLTAVDPVTRNGIVSGWLTNEKGSGVLFSDVKNDTLEIKTQIDYGHFPISPKTFETTETFLIGYFDDARLGEEQFADALATYNNVKLRERIAVYCTWYSDKNGGAGSEESTIELSNYVKEHLEPYGLKVIQIDDQWQAGGSYNGPARGFDRARKTPLNKAVVNGTADGFPANYPNGMEKTAKAIKDDGLVAGIWWMPFARNHQDPEYAERQHWFAKRTNGKPYETVWGGTSLDLTHPEVQEHIKSIAQSMVDWGFNYFKMDGLWTGTVTEQIYINDGYKNDSIGNNKPLYDPSITQIEGFRNGLKLIRESTNNEVFLSGCAISQNMRSFGASIGLVDAMRIGPDFNHDGESIRTGAIRASRLYFLNGRIWWNDPDPSMLREIGESTADPKSNGIGSLTRARLLPSFVAISGQLFLSSDWIPDLPKERIEIMKRCMASHQGISRPVDAFDKNLPSIWLATDNKTGIERNVIGLYNWKTSTDKIECSLDWAGLDDKTNYYAFDFWSNKPLPEISDSFSAVLPSESCQIIALRAKSNHPVVVSTSQHVTQGMIDLKKEEWNDGILSGTSKIIANDPYEIRITGLNDGGKWFIDNAKILGDLDLVSIEVLPQNEEGWLRVVIKSKKSIDVKWQLMFNNLQK